MGGGFYRKVLPIFIILLVFALSISYAYFTSKNNIGELNNNKLEEETAVIQGTELTLAGKSLEAEGVNVYPGHKEIVELIVSALHNNGPVNYNLEWVGTNTLTSEVIYKIYKSEQKLAPNIACKTISKGGMKEIQYYEECTVTVLETLEVSNPYQEGTIINSEIEETQTLLYKEEITGNEEPKKVYYYVVIEYPNDPKNSQDSDNGEGYNGHFKLNNIADGTKVKKVNTSIGVLDINLDEPNFNNRSCLNGTHSTNHDGGNCEEETNGIYEETTTLGKTYYYRGTVNNNWVKYGTNEEGLPIWWRIIRINEDGTVRMIYAGEGEQAPASDEEGYWMSNSWGINSTSYAFNDSYNFNAYVGYMYGTPNSQTFNAEHGYDLINAGTVDQLQSSDIKKTIDEWYKKNLADEGSVLSGKTGFCGDRSISDDYLEEPGAGYGTDGVYVKYKAAYRVGVEPSFECPDSKHDLYTTKSDKGVGNGALDYPIGLITADEVNYAGGAYSTNYGYWLSTGLYFWTLSPYDFDGCAAAFSVASGGSLDPDDVLYAHGVRPTVNLKAEALTTEGRDGTITSPYVVINN